jgi:hypothetical protein
MKLFTALVLEKPDKLTLDMAIVDCRTTSGHLQSLNLHRAHDDQLDLGFQFREN